MYLKIILLAILSFCYVELFGQCSGTEKELIVSIVPDNFPNEISWSIENVATSSVIVSGNSSGTSVCLDSTICYEFTIYDSFGDGICCSQGQGSYELTYDGVVIKTGGEYDFQESHVINCAPFDSTNLPLVIINTNGQGIGDDIRIVADMKIIHNGPNQMNHFTDFPNNYDGKINIEKRGSSSQMFPKKSYSFETQDDFGNNNNVSLIDLPVENDWVLYAPYSDKTLMRNALLYELGATSMAYAPRIKFCEVILNDQYIGVYLLTEKIKRDNDRLDIAKLDSLDIAGDDLTGGYILKIDKTTGDGGVGWVSPYAPPGDPTNQINFLHHYPDDDEILPVQSQYIEDYVTDFENALNGAGFSDPITGYAAYMDLASFADFFIFNELSKNVDGYRISSYFYKDKDSKGGKLKAGPLWDFNIAFGNANYCEGNTSTGWQKDFNSICAHNAMVPFWWNKLLQDTVFANVLRCRWENARLDELSLPNIYGRIDSIANYLDLAQERNFDQWDVLGTYVWPNNYIGNSYQDEVNYLKFWIDDRINWMDSNMPGECPNVGVMDHSDELGITMYPNPVKDILSVNISGALNEKIKIQITNMEGKVVLKRTIESFQPLIKLSTTSFSDGIYLVDVSSGSFVKKFKLIKHN
ncbi:MAG: CotH kinase family protein [Crocinitomicaceae bacterium]|nr:CotH kinase family protein [Crocinitomicaceae bacterium]